MFTCKIISIYVCIHKDGIKFFRYPGFLRVFLSNKNAAKGNTVSKKRKVFSKIDSKSNTRVQIHRK